MNSARKKNLLWVIPVAMLAIAVLGILALPKFVASSYHRATIEALASSLTGRNVHINGALSLALLPQPQFIADGVTITSPDQETVTAASLTLDIAPLPLLRGQILAHSITLQSPHIALPWPLPGGAAAIAPPRWLTALHAQISNGEVQLGAVTFTQVAADIFTGSDGAFSISGTGDLFGYPINLSLGFGALSAVGSTPVTLDLQTLNAAKLQVHISGTYDSSSTVSGQASFGAGTLAAMDPILASPATGSADITADPNEIALNNLNVRQDKAVLSGSAKLALSPLSLTLLLTGQNLVLPLNAKLLSAANAASSVLPTQLTLDANDTNLAGSAAALLLPHLHSEIDFGQDIAKITALNASLPGNSTLWLSGVLNAAGALQAKLLFDSTELSDFFAAYGASPILPANWQEVSLAGDVSGTADQLEFSKIEGNFGPARVAGTAVLDQQRNLVGALHFDVLDLTPFAAMLRNTPNGFGTDALTGDFEVSADRASIDKIPLAHLLIDAALGHRFVVRRLSASVYGGIATASFTLSPNPGQSNGLVSSAHAVLALPSAQPIAALAPAWLQLPPALTRVPLALSFLAAGPANALSTSASLTLGAVSITASPSIDLIHETATGPFTFRHPDAISAFKAFGLDAGLPWPGAGSIALRANMLLSPTQIGFSDFVLSMGDLTANGMLTLGPAHQLNGQIDADTLALPPISPNFTPPWADLAQLQGKIAVSANRVLVAGNPIFGPADAEITLTPNRLELALSQASFANGIVKGDFTATPGNAVRPATPAPLAVAAKVTLSGADASQLGLPFRFPITVPSGNLDAAADLTATGYAPLAWLATLAGNASLSAHSGTADGFDLAAAAKALTGKTRRPSLLRAACLTGTTPFTQLSMTGSFASGIYTLTTATLQSPTGSATAAGSIDLPDTGIDLTAILLPAVPSPPQLGLTITGPWPTPRKTAALKQGLAWKPSMPKK
jgi:uncharacterized protein involved in outer membrane biogenesis